MNCCCLQRFILCAGPWSEQPGPAAGRGRGAAFPGGSRVAEQAEPGASSARWKRSPGDTRSGRGREAPPLGAGAVRGAGRSGAEGSRRAGRHHARLPSGGREAAAAGGGAHGLVPQAGPHRARQPRRGGKHGHKPPPCPGAWSSPGSSPAQPQLAGCGLCRHGPGRAVLCSAADCSRGGARRLRVREAAAGGSGGCRAGSSDPGPQQPPAPPLPVLNVGEGVIFVCRQYSAWGHGVG